MNDVWDVKILYFNKLVAEVLFTSELRAQDYADFYRESTGSKYTVTVVRREVLK